MHSSCCGSSASSQHKHEDDQFLNLFNSFLSKTRINKIVRKLDHNICASVIALTCILFSYLTTQTLTNILSQRLQVWGNVLFISAAYLLTLPPLLINSIQNIIITRDVDEHILMCLAACATLVLGCAIEGAILLALFTLSHQLEHKVSSQAKLDQKTLLSSMPSTAQLVNMSDIQNDTISLESLQQEIRVEEVKIGDLILIRPLSKVPLDGIVVFGESNISSQHITGEPLPKQIQKGDRIIAGSDNHEGMLVMRTTTTSVDSTAAQIVALVQQTIKNKPQVQTLLEKVSKIWCKAVLGITLISFVVLQFLGVGMWGEKGAIYRCLGLFTVGAPCALAVIPLAYTCIISNLAQKGVLVRGGKVIDALSEADVIALDKTGTLTTGELKVANKEVIYFDEVTGVDVDNVVYQLSQMSQHPTSVAIQNFYGTLDRRKNGHKIDENFAQNGQHSLQSSLTTLGHQQQHKLKPQSILKGEKVTDVQNETYRSIVSQKQVLIGNSQSPIDQKSSSQLQLQQRQKNFSIQEYESQDLVSHNGFKNGNGFRITSISQLPGKGVEGNLVSVDGKTYNVRFGSYKFTQSLFKQLHITNIDAKNLQTANKISSFLTLWQEAEGNTKLNCVVQFDFEDSLHNNSINVVQRIQNVQRNKSVHILSGDKQSNVQQIAKSVGITSFKSGLNPHQKAKIIQQWQQENHQRVVMVGDGANDALALAQADVGISLVDSVDNLVSESSDVVVANSQKISIVPYLLACANFTRTIILQNLGLVVVSVLAGVVPMLGGIIPLWLAAIVHEGTTLIVALNSLRCQFFLNTSE
eukprot:TRINITY_DN4657_c0_g2_i1.p1 TRINITY_DN4657_c0_g2~~TRINITY_DN4657_c0_g2_i1.p1  ORF type:complete len:924 (-),score=76.23 TRINITY_DN4657_c0_g2_i1:398-2824(-)